MVYKKFNDWCTSKMIDKPTESDCMAYFVERANSVKPSSLWAEYSMINSSLVGEKGVDLKQFSSLTEFMKRQALGYQSQRKCSKLFTKDQIIRFINEAPDDKYLMMKVNTY